MLKVNTIEFDGAKAVLNSYSTTYVDVFGTENIEHQRADWARRFPNATVRTENLTETETRNLVAESESRRPADYRGHYYPAHEIGNASNTL